jgi:hypothetical protein
VPNTIIDLGLEYRGGIAKSTAEQAGNRVRVDATGLNLEYPGTQILLATGTWDAESDTIHVKGSGARGVSLPDPTNDVPGATVLIVDALGNAAAGNITITPVTSINGAATLVLSTNYASARLQWVSAGVWVRV